MPISTSYATPPRTHRGDGALRSVGIEIEYAGPSLDAAVQLILDRYGGERLSENAFRHKVLGTRLGDFKVEMDASLLGEERYLDFLRGLGVPVEGSWMHELLGKIGIDVEAERMREAIDEVLEGLAGGVVPYEIVTPPIPLDALAELDGLVDDLRRLDAKGTSTSLLHAFGLHLNPEISALDVDDLLAVLRAALLLYDWFVWIGDVDLKRRLGPFIDRFPEEYVRLVLEPKYAPDLDRFTDDYLRSNPTRNRWLDLLPLLAQHDLERVRRSVKEPALVRPRPTFHYRLPNSMIDDPDWSIATEWNRWVLVERLAADPGWLGAMLADHLQFLDAPLAYKHEKWVRRCARWLEAKALANAHFARTP